MIQQKTALKGKKMLISCKLMLNAKVILLMVLKRRGILIVEFGRMMDWMELCLKKILMISCRLILDVNVNMLLVFLKRRKILIVE